MKKHIAIITTGGTIAMKADPAAGGLVPAVSGDDLAASVPGLTDYADIDVREFSNIPSEYMTPEKMLSLARYIDALAEEPGIDGFVVTHGTDTLEETAFFLDATIHTKKPLCLTGAMRGASAVSADGPANILGAVRTAADDRAKDMDVLVVMNDRIHAAWDVEKTHATCTDTFQSPQWGPVGTVYSSGIVFGRRTVPHMKLHPSQVTADVWLLKCGAGMDGTLFQLAKEYPAGGVVVEGFGCGNVTMEAAEGMRNLVKAQIPVVLVSRTSCGQVEKEYGYAGGAAALEKAGVILGGSLSGQKARILLLLGLGASLSTEELRNIFGQ